MPYATDIADLLERQLARFATSHNHQLAAQAANLDFWVDELLHCLNVIDGYKRRFERLSAAWTQYLNDHGTRQYDLIHDKSMEHAEPVPPPKRIDSRALQATRQRLTDTAQRLLLRLHKTQMIDTPRIRIARNRLGIQLEREGLVDAPALNENQTDHAETA